MSDERASILITGGARGIGRACARRFAAAGWRVGLYDIDAADLDATVTTLAQEFDQAQVWGAALDVTKRVEIDEAVADFAARTGGRMRVLLNNAGIMRVGRFEQLDPGEHRRTVAVNLQGVIDLAHACFPLLRDTPGARLVNLSSASAIYGIPELASYSASKSAVSALTEALDIEWAVHDIRVSDVRPLFVQTDLLTDTAPLSAERWFGVHLEAADVAKVVWRAATGGRHRVHWPVGLQGHAAHLLARAVPRGLQRALLRLTTKD